MKKKIKHPTENLTETEAILIRSSIIFSIAIFVLSIAIFFALSIAIFALFFALSIAF